MATARFIQYARELGRQSGAQATVLAGAVLASALVWPLLFHYLEHQEEDAIAAASAANANLAQEVSRHLLQIVKDLQLQTEFLVAAIKRDGVRNADLTAFKNNLASTLPMVVEISVIDAAGNELSSSRPNSGPYPSGREILLHHAMDDSGKLRIGTPLPWRSTGKTLIPASHRLNSAGGAFAGVLHLAIDPERLVGAFGIILPAGGSITLLNEDGIVLARNAGTGDTVSPGQDISASAWFRKMKDTRTGVVVIERPTDRQRRIVAFESLGRYRLTVRVGSSVDEVLTRVRQHRPGYYAAATLMSALLLCAGLLLAWSFNRQKQVNRVMAAAKQRAEHLQHELRELAAHHETIREEERAHIARELHDQLGQVLTGVKLHLSAMGMRHAQDEAYTKQNAYVMRQVEQAITVVRQVVTDLRPPALDQGLGAAVAWLADRFSRRTGIACSANADNFDINERQAIALFRVLQESLNNIVRHAEAKNVQVTLTRAGQRIRLQVSDDGKGFIAERTAGAGGFGLVGMRERVAMLSGDLTIRSAPGNGTTIAAEIEIEEACT